MKKHKEQMDEIRLFGPGYLNPVEMLKEEHEQVKHLFEDFEHAESDAAKQRIVKETILQLRIHAAVEEEIFYPALREHCSGEEEISETLDEALEEHHCADLLLQELEEMGPGDDRYDAKFRVLSQYVKHHMEEEESEMMPRIDVSEEDWPEIAEEMAQRREELQTEFREFYQQTHAETHPHAPSKPKGAKTHRRSRMRHH